ncbi:MAG: NAD(P) transhydrogenase subunit alpha [Verrucomicrobiota bacterium]
MRKKLAIRILAAMLTSGTLFASEGAQEVANSMDFMGAIFVFMLATFIGLDVIRKVSRLLHTPLMSLTNAISAISVVGALIVAGSEYPTFVNVLGLIAVVAAVTNIVSGFLITDRMLKMFKKRTNEKTP